MNKLILTLLLIPNILFAGAKEELPAIKDNYPCVGMLIHYDGGMTKEYRDRFLKNPKQVSKECKDVLFIDYSKYKIGWLQNGGYQFRALSDEIILFMQKLEKAGYTKKQIIELMKSNNLKLGQK